MEHARLSPLGWVRNPTFKLRPPMQPRACPTHKGAAAETGDWRAIGSCRGIGGIAGEWRRQVRNPAESRRRVHNEFHNPTRRVSCGDARNLSPAMERSMLSWFKPKPSSAARLLAKEGARQRKERIRAQVDRMNAELGRPPIRWPAL